MTLKCAHDEIQQLAADVAAMPIPGLMEVAAATMKAAESLAVVPAEGKTASEVKWQPPHNLALRPTAMGWSGWVFTLLPYFPTKRAFREDLNGIVIRPMWRMAAIFGPQKLKTATQRLADGPTIAATVDKELTWMEHRFGIEVPPDIRAGLVADSLRQARLRWGVPPSRIRDRLIPLDGAMPRDL
jgi:hypothetical protein